MKKFKAPLRFGLRILPLCIFASLLTFFYRCSISEEAMKAQATQMGGMAVFLLAGLLQMAVMGFLACFFGWILAHKLELPWSLKIEKMPLLRTFLAALTVGLLLFLDSLTLGKVYPAIQEVNRQGQTLIGIAAAVLYGGIMEEILMRLLLMSLIAFLLWKLLGRKQISAPSWTLIAANLITALVFAAGHLPAALVFFGELTPTLLLRCFLLNGLAGLLFGWLYRRYGLSYAMLCHMGSHLVFKLFFGLFF